MLCCLESELRARGLRKGGRILYSGQESHLGLCSGRLCRGCERRLVGHRGRKYEGWWRGHGTRPHDAEKTPPCRCNKRTVAGAKRLAEISYVLTLDEGVGGWDEKIRLPTGSRSLRKGRRRIGDKEKMGFLCHCHVTKIRLLQGPPHLTAG